MVRDSRPWITEPAVLIRVSMLMELIKAGNWKDRRRWSEWIAEVGTWRSTVSQGHTVPCCRAGVQTHVSLLPEPTPACKHHTEYTVRDAWAQRGTVVFLDRSCQQGPAAFCGHSEPRTGLQCKNSLAFPHLSAFLQKQQPVQAGWAASAEDICLLMRGNRLGGLMGKRRVPYGSGV